MQSNENKINFIICLGSSCFARGNKELVQQLQQYFNERHLLDYISFKGTRCFGECKDGPFCKIDDKLVTFKSLQEVKEYLALHYPQLKNLIV